MGTLAYSFQPKVIMTKKWKKYNITTSESVICCVQNERNKKRPKEKRAFHRAARNIAILTKVTQSVCVTFDRVSKRDKEVGYSFSLIFSKLI